MTTRTFDRHPLDDLGPHLIGSSWESAPHGQWVAHAWGILARAGIVPERPAIGHRNYADHLVTMAALVHLSAVFADESRDGSVAPPAISGDAPLLSPLELGRYAERSGIRTATSPESPIEVARHAVRARMPAVARALVAEIGVSQLFADLWVATHPDAVDSWRQINPGTLMVRQKVSYPLPDEVAYQVLNTLSVSKMTTFEWLNELAPDR